MRGRGAGRTGVNGCATGRRRLSDCEQSAVRVCRHWVTRRAARKRSTQFLLALRPHYTRCMHYVAYWIAHSPTWCVCAVRACVRQSYLSALHAPHAAAAFHIQIITITNTPVNRPAKRETAAQPWHCVDIINIRWSGSSSLTRGSNNTPQRGSACVVHARTHSLTRSLARVY